MRLFKSTSDKRRRWVMNFQNTITYILICLKFLVLLSYCFQIMRVGEGLTLKNQLVFVVEIGVNQIMNDVALQNKTAVKHLKYLLSNDPQVNQLESKNMPLLPLFF